MAGKLINCKTCGAEIAKNAKACPQCGAKNKKSILKRWWFWVIVVFAVLIVIGSSGNKTDNKDGSAQTQTAQKTSTGETATASPEITYTHYIVTELFDDLNNNALKAEKMHQDEYVEIEGYLSVIDSDGKYISVGAGPYNYDYFLQDIHCNIRTDELRETVMELSKDDAIVVRGKIKAIGEILGYVIETDSIN